MTLAGAPALATPSLERLETHDGQWEEFVRSREESLTFHLPAWTDTLAEAYGFRCFCLVLRNEAGAIVAGAPVVETSGIGRRRWSSLPFSDLCPILGEPSDVARLVAAIPSLAAVSGIRGVELREGFEGPGDRVSRGVVHELRIDRPLDEIVAGYSKSQVRRNIRRAQREGVVIRHSRDPDDLLTTFLNLHLLTRRRLGLPVQPRSFFKPLWSNMLAAGHGFILIAYIGPVPAAAALFLLGTRTVTYKYGASNAAYWSQRPNHLLFAEAIRWSHEQGYTTFDFGRSDWENSGLRAFKSSWGATERELVYTFLGSKPIHPPEIGETLMRPVIRRSPKWANQALGRLLYRFAA